ncbi:MAG: DUF6248 family natural product biosynthesis protein [Pseudonocardiaceae bacterium]
MADSTVMDPGGAAWVKATVWTAAMRKGMVEPTECPCQWGMTGWCSMGRHHRCQFHQNPTPQPSPETRVVNSRAEVLSYPGSRPAEVWLAGRACAWRCPCECHTTGQLGFGGAQLVLF